MNGAGIVLIVNVYDGASEHVTTVVGGEYEAVYGNRRFWGDHVRWALSTEGQQIGNVDGV